MGCGPGRAEPVAKKAPLDEPARPLELISVEERGVERAIQVVGSLLAHERANLSAKVPGKLEKLFVDIGTPVTNGQILAQIDKRDFELRVLQAEAALAQARARLGLALKGEDDAVEPAQTSTVKEARAVLVEAEKNKNRLSKLVEQGVIADAEFETVQAGYDVASNRYQDALQEVNNRRAMLAQRRAEYEIARQQLLDSALLAPFDGVVQERQAGPGEYVSAAAPLITLVRVNPLRLRLEVPELEAPRVHPGQQVRLRLDGVGKAHTGLITRLSPSISDSNRMLFVEADIPNDGSLRPGAFARAEIVVQSGVPALVIPKSAITTFAGIQKVFIVQEGHAVEKTIRTGSEFGDEIEVISGIKKGDRLILSPGNLRNGDKVRETS